MSRRIKSKKISFSRIGRLCASSPVVSSLSELERSYMANALLGVDGGSNIAFYTEGHFEGSPAHPFLPFPSRKPLLRMGDIIYIEAQRCEVRARSTYML